MKFSYRWLSELVPGLDAAPEKLERLITLKTAECEGVFPYGSHFDQVLAARIVSAEPLPKGKNKSVLIELGDGVQKRVVCGAPNVRDGMIAAWVPPGTSLNGKLITEASIEGVQSQGMLASASELGINRDHSGLLELHNVQPGSAIPALSPDWIVEIDNKSLTHRPDLWGHYGMAREVAAITHGVTRDPVDLTSLPTGAGPTQIEIEDERLCPRYSALLVENIAVSPSPLWLQTRLESIGLNSINNIVDITNLVLAELPQPMHAFDADKLTGNRIVVRNAREGETLKALNGETYTLHSADLVIADEGGPIALAGVIGGADSAISETTTRIVFESANFQASSVRLTSSRHKLRTDASIRFEKSQDPENTMRGLARAADLLHELSPGARMVGGPSDLRAPAQPPPVIALPIDFVVRKLGKQVSREEITGILQALGFSVKGDSQVLTVTVPTWRATKDISLKEDLVEEVGRIIGYGEITPVPPLAASVVPPANPVRDYLRRMRQQLVDQGFTEVYNYSFVNETETRRFSMPIEAHLAVRNPIASEQTHLRRSLLPGLFKNLVSNVRHFQEFRLFEIGNEIHAGQTTHAAALIYSIHGNEEDFFEAKRVLEGLFPGSRLNAADALPYEHPSRAAQIAWRGENIGRVFELHPSLLQAEGIAGRAVFFDVDTEKAQTLASAQTVLYRQLRKYPTSAFDLSVISGERVPAARIEDELRVLGGDSVAALEFVRQYSGPPLPEGQKSVSYRIEVGSLDHTLTADEAGEIRHRMIQGMRSLGYKLRV